MILKGQPMKIIHMTRSRVHLPARSVSIHAAAILMCGLLVAQADLITFPVNIEVPDNDPTGLQDTQTLGGYEGTIVSIEMRLTMTQSDGDLSWVGDYYVTLQHDSGFAVVLNRVGRSSSEPLGYSDSGFDITLTAVAPDVHQYQTYTPSYDSQGRLTGTWGMDGRHVDPDSVLDTDPQTAMLTSFHGLDANGDWTIFVADLNQNGTVTLDSWGLDITTVPEPSTLSLIGIALGWLYRRKRVRVQAWR